MRPFADTKRPLSSLGRYGNCFLEIVVTFGILVCISFIIYSLEVAEGATITVDDDGEKDHTTIQAAVNAANPDDEIIVYDGTYVENIVISTDSLHLYAHESSVVVVDGDSADSTIHITGDDVSISGFQVTNCSNIAGKAGIAIHGDDVDIENCVVEDNGKIGIRVDGSVQRAQIKKCILDLNGASGIAVLGEKTTIEGCFVNNSYSSGVTVQGGKETRILASFFAGNNRENHERGGGINFRDGANSASVVDCIVQDNKGFGVRIYSSDHVTLEETVIQDLSTYGLLIEGSSNRLSVSTVSIEGCTYGVYFIDASSSSNTEFVEVAVSNSSQHGFSLQGSNHLIKDSLVRDNTEIGIEIRIDAPDNAIENCILENNGASGIAVWSSNTAITGCDVSESGFSGITVKNGEGAMIRESSFVDNNRKTHDRGGGINLRDGAHFAIIDNCIVRENPGFGIRLMDTDQVTITSTCILDGSKYGLLIEEGSNDNNLSELRLKGCENNIYLLGSGNSGNTIEDSLIFGSVDYGAYSTGSVLKAENNWWGDETGPYHPDDNPDGNGGKVSDNIDFSSWLTEAPNLFDPVIETSDMKECEEDADYSVIYEASDRDEDSLTWSLTTNAVFLSLDPTSGLLQGTPVQQNVGSWWVNVTVSDSERVAYRNFTLAVLNVNDAPVITTTTDLATATEGELYSTRYEATDEDLDVLSWSLTTVAKFLTIDFRSGLLEGTPTLEDLGQYQVKIEVSDGVLSDSGEFTLEVINVNNVIEIVITAPTDGATVVGVISITGTAHAAEGSLRKVEISIDSKEWLVTEGTEFWSYDLNTRSFLNGAHQLNARGFDGIAYSSIVTIEITVDNPASEVPNFEVSSSGITLLGTKEVGSQTTIVSTIYNIGGGAGEVMVTIYLSSIAPENLMLQSKLFLEAGGTKLAIALWTPQTAGTKVILVTLEDQTGTEEDTTNNQAEQSFQILAEGDDPVDEVGYLPGFAGPEILLAAGVMGDLVAFFRRSRS